MTTRSTNTADYFSTDAAYRTWVTWWDSRFREMGLVQTADPNQVNLGTITRGTAGNPSTNGYQIWKFNDGLKDAAPIFFKVEYGSGALLGNAMMWFSVGTGSDNTGFLTYSGWPTATSLIPRRQMAQYSSATAGNQTANIHFTYLSNFMDDHSFGFLAWPTPTQDQVGTWFFAIERWRNADGTPSPDGVTVTHCSAAAYGNYIYQDNRHYMTGLSQQTTSAVSWSAIAHPQQNNPGALVGTTLYPPPVFTGIPPRLASPSQFVTLMGLNDLAATLTFNLDHYGRPCTWVSAGTVGGSGFGNLLAGTTRYQTIAFRTDPV